MTLKVVGTERDAAQGDADGGVAAGTADLGQIAEFAAGSATPGFYDGHVVLESTSGRLKFKAYIGVTIWYE